MKTLKHRILLAIVASLFALGVSTTSMASYDNPNFQDVHYAVKNIVIEIEKIIAKVMIDIKDIKVVNIENILTDSEINIIKDVLNDATVKLQVITLQNTLNNIKILNGINILTFQDFLSNNNLELHDVIAIKIFDNKVLVFGCKAKCK